MISSASAETTKEPNMGEKTIVDLVNESVAGAVQPAIDKAMAEVQKKYASIYDGAAEERAKKGIKDPEPGIRIARYAKCVLAAETGKGDLEFWAKSIYPNDTELQAYTKTAMSVSTPSEGGYAVPEVLSSEIIQYLYPKLVLTKLGARKVDMPNGNLSIPRFNATSSAYYIGENRAATKSQATLGSVKLSAKKLAVLVPISNDLIRSASPIADAMIRDDMVQISQLKRDYVAFYGAGTLYTPSGLAALLTTTEKYGGASTAFTADIPGYLLGELMGKNIPMISVGWTFSGRAWAYLYNLKTSTGAYIYRAEMDQGKLLGYPFFVSNQIAYTAGSPGYVDIFLGDFSEYYDAVQMEMQMEASREATYVDDAGATISAFSNDQTVLRLLTLHDYNVRHKESFIQGTYKLATS